jgi:hypothetical protein
MKEKTIFGLRIQLDPRIELTEDNQLVIPSELTLPDRAVAKGLDVIEVPFIAMTAEHWNQFQNLIDKLNVRQEFRNLNLSVITVPRSNIMRPKENVK